MSESSESTPTTEPATPATEGVAGLIAAAVEQTLAQLSDDAFAELTQRVRPPAAPQEQPAPEPVQQPQADRPPARIPTEPTEQQKRDAERYSSVAYPASWGFQPEGSN